MFHDMTLGFKTLEDFKLVGIELPCAAVLMEAFLIRGKTHSASWGMSLKIMNPADFPFGRISRLLVNTKSSLT
jgi:hypothetical protein